MRDYENILYIWKQNYTYLPQKVVWDHLVLEKHLSHFMLLLAHFTCQQQDLQDGKITYTCNY